MIEGREGSKEQQQGQLVCACVAWAATMMQIDWQLRGVGGRACDVNAVSLTDKYAAAQSRLQLTYSL